MMIKHAVIQPALLDITRIALNLQKCAVGHTIDYHGITASTMPLAYALASRRDTRSGTLVVAEEQSSGLGRLQRRWEAPAIQAILVSLILKHPQLPAKPTVLPMLAGVALVHAIVRAEPELADEIGIKWPNDILLGDDLATGRKVAGILIETAYRQNRMEHAVVGMGINVNQEVAGLPNVPSYMPQPTSLRVQVGRVLDRTALLIALCQVWDELLGPQRSEHDIFQEWRSLLYTLGQPVTVRRGDGEDGQLIQGTAVDVTPDGELVVVDESNVTHVLMAGEVTSRIRG